MMKLIDIRQNDPTELRWVESALVQDNDGEYYIYSAIGKPTPGRSGKWFTMDLIEIEEGPLYERLDNFLEENL